jgi:hypothetical protein
MKKLSLNEPVLANGRRQAKGPLFVPVVVKVPRLTP